MNEELKTSFQERRLPSEAFFDFRMVEITLLQHVKKIENFVSDFFVLDDFVSQKGSGKVLRRKTHNQLLMREFLYQNRNGFLPAAVVFKAVPDETTIASSHVIPA